MYIGGPPTKDILLSLSIRHPQCLMLCDGLGLTSSFIVVLFLLPLWSDFILVWIIEVVCIVLRIIVCLYMSPFSSCSGQCLSVPVHVCSSSPGKEVRSSLCQKVALPCGPKRWSHFPWRPISEHCLAPWCDETLHDAP